MSARRAQREAWNSEVPSVGAATFERYTHAHALLRTVVGTRRVDHLANRCRDAEIRTRGLHVPNVARYQAALHPVAIPRIRTARRCAKLSHSPECDSKCSQAAVGCATPGRSGKATW